MDLSPPKFWIADTFLSARWALNRENVWSWKYDRNQRTWTVQTARGFFSYPSLRHTLVWAWRARYEHIPALRELCR